MVLATARGPGHNDRVAQVLATAHAWRDHPMKATWKNTVIAESDDTVMVEE